MGLTVRPKGITETHLKLANIGQDYWDCDFLNYKGPKEAKTKVLKYLLSLDEMKEKGVGLLLVGPHGPGKTTLAMVALKYLARANWNVYATSLGEVIEQIQKSWSDRSSDSTDLFIERARSADFLLIDDVGKEHRGQSGFTERTFDNLVRYRVQHRLPTFLTTNHTKSELLDVYGESAISLLEGKLIPITVNGGDFRRTEQKRDIRETLK